jgi:hypothetical protein
VRRIIIGLVACVSSSAAVLAVACGGGGSSHASGPDGGGTGDDGGVVGEATLGNTCGDAPWVNVNLQVQGISLSGDLPLPGVAMTSPLCPGIVQVSDEAGVIQGQISKDVPFYGSLQKNVYLPELTPEESFASDQSVSFEMLPALFAGLLHPPFVTGTSNAILVSARVPGDAGADAGIDAGQCSQLDGIAFSVAGHSEAQVTYYTNDTLPSWIDGGTATSPRGLASISGLAPGQFVTVTGAKPGCHVALSNATLTGRVRVEQGFLSLMPAYISP